MQHGITLPARWPLQSLCQVLRSSSTALGWAAAWVSLAGILAWDLWLQPPSRTICLPHFPSQATLPHWGILQFALKSAAASATGANQSTTSDRAGHARQRIQVMDKATEKWMKKQERVRQKKARREARQNRMRYFWLIHAIPSCSMGEM